MEINSKALSCLLDCVTNQPFIDYIFLFFHIKIQSYNMLLDICLYIYTIVGIHFTYIHIGFQLIEPSYRCVIHNIANIPTKQQQYTFPILFLQYMFHIAILQYLSVFFSGYCLVELRHFIEINQ